MSAPYYPEIPEIYYDMAWDEFNNCDFDDEINDMVQDHSWDATHIALATCYPMSHMKGGSIFPSFGVGKRARFPDAERDFKAHVEAIIERRAGELMEENS